MLAPPSLCFVTDPEGHAAARSRLDAVLAAWPGLAPPVLELDASDLLAEEATLEGGVAWFVLESPTSGDLFELIAHAEDAHVPALLTSPSESGPLGKARHDGVILCPADADAATVSAVLAAMWSQARVIDLLKLEARALQTQSRGVGDQLGKVDEELRLAGKLQREFLPRKLPSLHGVSFDVIWKPAGYVGGDIYDAFRLDERHLGFFIADAVGHGVPAALMTMVIKQSLETKAVCPDSPRGYRLIGPGEALAKVNAAMCESQTGSVRFATACYGIIDCVERVLTFARAGHPYPLLLRDDGDPPRIEVEGGLLGVFPEEEYEEVTYDLRDGDRLLVFSDGFETAFPEAGEQEKAETANRRGLFSERYLQEFADLANGPVDEAMARLEKRVYGEAGSLNQKDDLTLLCLSINAVANAAAA